MNATPPPPPSPPVKVLVVDDGAEDRDFYQLALRSEGGRGFELDWAETGEEGLAACRSFNPDCVLLDFSLPDMDGLDFLAQAAVDGVVPMAVVMVTGYGSEDVAIQAMKKGAQDYLVKGQITRKQLVRAINNSIEKVTLRRQLEGVHRQLVAERAVTRDFVERIDDRPAGRQRSTAADTADREDQLRQRLVAIKILEAEKARNQKLLARKDALYADLQRRVRNNLQTILFLLTAHVLHARQPAVREGLATATARIQVIADVEDKLHGSPLSVLAIGPYFTELAGRTIQASGKTGLRCEVLADRFLCPADMAPPLAMIVHELLTNAVGHGFPGGRTGLVTVSLRQPEPGTAILSVADDGRGSPGFSMENKGLGLTIVEDLAEQMKGKLTVSGTGGFAVTLTFPFQG